MDDVGVVGYYASETSTTPSASSSGWTSVTSATSYSANVSFTLSSGDGTKTVYVCFKDVAGNVSASASDSIILSAAEIDYQFITEWIAKSSGIEGLDHIWGIAVDSSNNVYITSGAGIQKFTSNGSFITSWGFNGIGNGQFLVPNGIAVDSSGNVYVVDAYFRIQKFSSNGTFITKWGSQGVGDGQFYQPWAIAVDLSGNVYVSDVHDGRIQKFTSKGNFISKWYHPDGVVYGIAIDSSGNIYIADSGYVNKYDPNGTFITKWDSVRVPDNQGGWGYAQNPQAIAIDSLGNVYVAYSHAYPDFLNPNILIQKFTSTGKFITGWSSYGLGNGQVSSTEWNCS